MQISHTFIAKVHIGNDEGRANISLHAREDYPLSYTMEVHVQNIEWVFARSLLSEAFENEGEEIGEGDVITRVDGPHFLLTLSSPEGEATLILPSIDVLDFIMESSAQVPPQRVEDTISADLELFLATLNEE